LFEQDLATTACFLDHLEMGFDIIKMTAQEVDLRSLGSVAQSVLGKACKGKGEADVIGVVL